jgi:predicted RNA-binding Zn-ribbon protein involved in translation (DUF1610 family)
MTDYLDYLRDDLNRMEGADCRFYSDDERNSIEKKIEQVEAILEDLDLQLIEAAAELLAALKSMRKLYGDLHDGLSDMVEGGRLTEAKVPDDYRWVVDSLSNCIEADQLAEKAITRIGAKDDKAAVEKTEKVPYFKCPACGKDSSIIAWLTISKKTNIENGLAVCPSCGAKDLSMAKIRGNPEEWDSFLVRISFEN